MSLRILRYKLCQLCVARLDSTLVTEHLRANTEPDFLHLSRARFGTIMHTTVT